MARYPILDALRSSQNVMRWMTLHEQPIRRDFDMPRLTELSGGVEILQRNLSASSFCHLTQFGTHPAAENHILLVTPLSGHFPFLFRELIAGMVDYANVSVTEWLNVRHVPMSAGEFGFDENIKTVIDAVRTLGPCIHIIAICQGVLPALAATAILAKKDGSLTPQSLTLIAGPVDPLANPTRVVKLLRQQPVERLQAAAIEQVDASFLGAGRLVYPAHHQYSALSAYLIRHWLSGGELLRKTIEDDGFDAAELPFLELYSSLMDLPAQYFLENIRKVFKEREHLNGSLLWRNELVDFGAIRNTALITIEGADDDVAAPGQTSAAHHLCPNVADRLRRSLIIPDSGHFSLFHGQRCRQEIVEKIKTMCQEMAVSLPS